MLFLEGSSQFGSRIHAKDQRGTEAEHPVPDPKDDAEVDPVTHALPPTTSA